MASILPGRITYVDPTHPAVLLQSGEDDPLQWNTQRKFTALLHGRNFCLRPTNTEGKRVRL
jgi:hypothetical protein